ncbi:MAG: curli production assembly protein CsgG [Acidobacteria bacterium]|nr:curli production assembly protein CsgG [Acidobacteriota bacterium]
MKRISLVVAALLVTVAVSPGQQKTRVAVMNFDYATVQSSVSAIFGTNQDIGKGIADLLVDKLVNDGAYSVIERKALDKIIAEQNFSNSDRADPLSAAKIGKILGVDAIVIGSITQFGRDDKKTTVGGGGLGGLTGRFGLGGVSRNEAKAVVAITARMVNTTTGEILASATGRGESNRSGTSLIGAGGSNTALGAGGLDMRASNFANSILGEAVHQAVNTTAQQLDARAGSMPTHVVTVDGLVADAAPDGTLILNVGSQSGVKVGDRLAVKRLGRKIMDPATGKVLRQVEEAIGQVTITEVEASSSTGKFSGTGTPKVGDAVKNQ